jgi:hypothetical protein
MFRIAYVFGGCIIPFMALKRESMVLLLSVLALAVIRGLLVFSKF